MEDAAAADLRAIGAVLGGDGAAFGELVTRYQKLVGSIAWRYGTRREEIEDVVSEVFCKVYRNLAQYRPDHPFPTWLYRLAANHVLDHARRQKRAGVQAEMPVDLKDPGVGPEDQALLDQRASRVRAALAQLAPHYRETLFLVYVEGQSVEDSGRTLGVPTGTIKSRLMRGRQALRSILERDGDI